MDPITSLILTLVAFVVFYILITFVMPPVEDARVSWAFRAIAALILVLVICRIWGLGI